VSPPWHCQDLAVKPRGAGNADRLDQQLVALQAPEVQLLQLITPPAQVMQQRCWVPLEFCWQYRSVQACARAEGNKNSSVALLSRPNDLRMVLQPFCSDSRHGGRSTHRTGVGNRVAVWGHGD
jgi:hypothetical protein